MSRNSSRGNPSAITHFDVELNTRQNNLLLQLPNLDSSVIVKKHAVNLNGAAILIQGKVLMLELLQIEICIFGCNLDKSEALFWIGKVKLDCLK